MTRVKLTKENVRKDILSVSGRCRALKPKDQPVPQILAFSALAAVVGFLFKKPWLALLIAVIPIYYIVKTVCLEVAHRKTVKSILDEIKNGELAVSEDTFSHISEDYERAGSMSRGRTVFYTLNFNGGFSWRIPLGGCYSWSRELNLSCAGMVNTSVQGNKFYVISSKSHPEACYVYNTDLFTLWDEEETEKN